MLHPLLTELLVSEDWDKVGKPPAEKVMTDGCGFINYAALLAIKHHLNYTSVPTAVQGRIAGAKGLWTRHPTDTRDRPIIWIRDSQNKIEYSTLDRAHRILDLLDASHPAPSSSIHRLSAQSIVNLSHNKVPGEVFESFMKDGLEALVGPLMDWFQPFSKVSMYDALDKMGSVHGSRMTRMAGGQSRALGLSKRQWRNSYALTNELDSVDDDESEKHLGELNHTAGLKKHSGGIWVFAHYRVMPLLINTYSSLICGRNNLRNGPGEFPSRQITFPMGQDAIYGGFDYQSSDSKIPNSYPRGPIHRGLRNPRFVSYTCHAIVKCRLNLFCRSP